MRLTFDFNIQNLEGLIFQGESHAGKLVANFLAQLNKGNAMKLWDWAQKLWNKTGIEVDETDAKMLEALIETSEGLPVITKAQLLGYIEEQRKQNK